MIKAQIIDKWTQEESTGAWIFSVALAYPITATDVTAQSSAAIPALNPNSVVVEIVADEAVFATIEADPAYHIIWSETI